MSFDLSSLNPQQRQAVTLIDRPLLLLAGAGSGKTRVITFRIAHLIERGIPAKKILALTFTNKAAGEMAERVKELLGPQGRGVTVTTFHSLCVRFLREYIHLLGYQKDFVIFDTAGQMACVKNCLEEIDLDSSPANVKSIYFEIMKHKGDGLKPKDLTDQTKNPHAVQLGKLYLEYNKHLKDYNALDFEDILYKGLELFEAFPSEVEPLFERYHQVMVDEYQDTNRVQYRLIKFLSERRRRLCVVGDDDQSIYGWRGADLRNILDFQKDYPDAEVIRLEQNYRSTDVILKAANSVIENNGSRMAKTLWTSDQNGAPLRWVKMPTVAEELDEVIHRCQVFRIRHSAKWSDFAFLYRSNFQSRAIEEALREASIPYQMIGGTKFFDRKEIQDCLAYLRFLHNPKDEVSLFRILNYPRRGIGKSSVEAIGKARQDGRGFYEVMTRAGYLTDLGPRELESIASFVSLVEEHKIRLNEGEPYALVFKELFERMDIEGEIVRSEKDEGKSEKKVTNYLEFINTLYLYGERREGSALNDFLDYVSLFTDQDGLDEKADKVNLLTVHSAKGLEFTLVALVGMTEDQFPSKRSVQDGQIEEERRLFYVAMTRAKKELVLSMSDSRMYYGEYIKNQPSRFIKEIKPELFEKPPFAEEAPEKSEARKADARADFFARLKKS
ncbi:MAG: hypothetical protein A2527_10650 [Candidatus Lambdaproteobacteria bacterium RIFOXYD2_FULL_50_16]|uniref:DNA 3'-5' helicase n=1 Tax=Candidatus Lambdaproteobacteria bacterium RIFOXYD2_FULL_50_16 TaxID=1817772 RepID=A0A1F6GGN7_9PROT|nr:MAG: hypothetical protein A2527_10650 [Candidatus Lambdaproteobacteria bacterium RIFOXYD2_FULL_50_16]